MDICSRTQLCLSICAAQAPTDAAVLKIMTVCSVELTAGVTARPRLRQEAVERKTARMVGCLLDAPSDCWVETTERNLIYFKIVITEVVRTPVRGRCLGTSSSFLNKRIAFPN